MRDIIELVQCLEARRPQLDALLRQVVEQNTPNAVIAPEEKNEDEDRKTEDTEAAASNPNNKGASCCRGKGKDKKRSHSKKGKGGKKK